MQKEQQQVKNVSFKRKNRQKKTVSHDKNQKVMSSKTSELEDDESVVEEVIKAQEQEIGIT